MLYLSNTLRVLCPLIVIATRSGMPLRTMLRTAVRRQSWKIAPTYRHSRGFHVSPHPAQRPFATHEGFDDADIKQALSELIHEGKIELTSHRMLKSPSEAAA